MIYAEREKGIVVKPKVSSLKQFWTEYRLMNNEKKIGFDKKVEISEDAAFDSLFEKLSVRVQEINRYCYKTPVDIVFATLEPERKFVSMLTSDRVAAYVDAWIKSRDVGFYSIDYQKNKGSKFKGFNPDFFIKIGDSILVVETKADGDFSEENRAKLKAGKRHFELLNNQLSAQGINQKYYFDFLSPIDYNTFFEYIIDGRFFSTNYRSSLEDGLERLEESME